MSTLTPLYFLVLLVEIVDRHGLGFYRISPDVGMIHQYVRAVLEMLRFRVRLVCFSLCFFCLTVLPLVTFCP